MSEELPPRDPARMPHGHYEISACGSNTLLEAHAPVFDKYLRYLIIAGVYRGEITMREHQILLECALKRDAATAIAVLKATSVWISH